MTPPTRMSRLADVAAWLLARLLAIVVPAGLATLAAVAVLRFGHGDISGTVAAAVIVGALVFLAHDAVKALWALAGAAMAAADALEEIEKSAAEIEHAAGLLEESADALSTAVLDAMPAAPADPAPLVPFRPLSPWESP